MNIIYVFQHASKCKMSLDPYPVFGSDGDVLVKKLMKKYMKKLSADIHMMA